MSGHFGKAWILGMLVLSQGAVSAETNEPRDKLDDDPTKVTTKAGVSWSDTYDLDDSNLSFSGSVALAKAKKLNARVNSDACEGRQYEEVFPKLQKSAIDIISLECQNSRVPMDLIELIRGKKVMVGAIDVATNAAETAEEVASTLRKALQFVATDKLYPSTNCGMVPLSRYPVIPLSRQVASGKLAALSAGADIVRREILGK